MLAFCPVRIAVVARERRIFNFDPATGAFSLNHQTAFFNEPSFSRKLEKPNLVYSAYYG